MGMVESRFGARLVRLFLTSLDHEKGEIARSNAPAGALVLEDLGLARPSPR